MAAVVGVVLLTASLASVSLSVSQKKDVAKEVSLRTELHSSASSDPVIITSGGETRTCSACDLLTARRRTKRCTCYTYKDKECVYYCHLDIIWINTPEHIVPYGLSSYPVSLRTKRSVEIDWKWSGASTRRCVCSLLTDPECKSFCTDSRQKGRLPATPKSKKRTAPFYKVDREWILK